MHSLLLSEAGGALTNGTIESLLVAPEPFFMVGVSSDPYGIHLAKTHVRRVVPQAKDPRTFIDALNRVLEEFPSDLIVSQHDEVIRVLAANRERLKAPVFLPPYEVVEICQDKYRSYVAWAKAGLAVPVTVLLDNLDDLEYVMRLFGQVWIREVRGGFGKNALPTGDVDLAKAWIDHFDGWGHFTAAECLTPDSVTWTSIWRNGALIVAQGRKRLNWKYSNRNLSGVTGVTGVGVTVSDKAVDDTALKAIFAIDKAPHGIYSVDMAYDREGVPNPTEINIGRFFTTHRFFTAAGLNMPYIMVKAALAEDIPVIKPRINPLEPGLAWVREMDSEPVLVRPEDM